MHLTDERVASAELEYLANSLRPPCQLGDYEITGQLARSATALLFTARGGVFGPEAEGVLKVTGTAYAPILQRELKLLLEATTAGIDNIVQPKHDELVWLNAGGERAARPAAGLALPFLSGGDVATLAERSARGGGLGANLALAVARPLGEGLRGLLTELARPVVHADVRAHNALLPSPSAKVGELTLIDLDAAHELDTDLRNPDQEAARLLAEDVRGFGDILHLMSGGA
ncbi:MAG TPA: hypothetical protein VFG86_05130, partial [Chloroflexota bacterium]|nr:hypothetical protein [Chloroflexota bacterium]